MGKYYNLDKDDVMEINDDDFQEVDITDEFEKKFGIKTITLGDNVYAINGFSVKASNRFVVPVLKCEICLPADSKDRYAIVDIVKKSRKRKK